MSDLDEVTRAIKKLSSDIDRILPQRRKVWHVALCVAGLLAFGGCVVAGCAAYSRQIADEAKRSLHAELERDRVAREEHARLEREAMFAMFTNLVSKLREDPKHFDKTEEQFEAVIDYYREKLNANRDTTPK